MEEREVTFNIVSNDSGEIVGITSDIDDDLNYLTLMDRICLVFEITKQICNQIFEGNLEDDIDISENESIISVSVSNGSFDI